MKEIISRLRFDLSCWKGIKEAMERGMLKGNKNADLLHDYPIVKKRVEDHEIAIQKLT